MTTMGDTPEVVKEKIDEVTRWLKSMDKALRRVNQSVTWRFHKSAENYTIRHEVWLTFKHPSGSQTTTTNTLYKSTKENLRNLLLDFCYIVKSALPANNCYTRNEEGYMVITFTNPYTEIYVFFNDCQNLFVCIRNDTTNSDFEVKAEDIFDAIVNLLLLVKEASVGGENE
jgi:hypothetical protein